MNLLITITLQVQSLTIVCSLDPLLWKKDINTVLKWRIWILLITFIIRFGKCKQEVYSSYCFSLLVSTTCLWVYFFFIIYKTESECVQMNTVWPIQEAVIHGAGDYQTMKQITLVLISTLWMISSFASLRLCALYQLH